MLHRDSFLLIPISHLKCDLFPPNPEKLSGYIDAPDFSPYAIASIIQDHHNTPPFYCDYGNNISFGNNCEVNMNCTFLDDNRIVIGDHALIAPNVQIYTAFHPTNAFDRFGPPQEDGSFAFCKTQTAPVVIGNDVWIGGGSILLPGVTIGDDVVIGAGSVVTKDIPSDSIAYGNPCRVVRKNAPKE